MNESSPTFGFFGRYLRVDLSTESFDSIALPESVLRRFLGGVGLGSYLLMAAEDYKHAPLSKSSSIAFCFSSLVGSPVTTSAKFAVVSRSPLTNMINDAMAGSAFALSGKKTGYDAIVITGKAKVPSVLLVDDQEVKLEPAGDVWGRDCASADEALREIHGASFDFSTIGLAGERQVRFATLSHAGRHAGRGGTGAVFGSKNLKAIGVQGSKRCDWAQPQKLVEISRELSKKSLGEATRKYRELGTIENLATLNRLGALPTQNFQSGTFEDAERYSFANMSRSSEKTRSSCAACTIGCEHIYKIKPSGDDSQTSARLEYENLFALGPLCGIKDPQIAIKASAKCDYYGLDTISTGATIAFAMECSQRGILEQDLQFGNESHLLSTIDLIGTQEGIGIQLGRGTRQLSEELGQGSAQFAPHVKGLELPGYEPRAMKTMALGFAVQTRGADHNRSGAYEADFQEGKSRLSIGPESARSAVDSEDKSALFDSLILCKFVRRVFSDFYSEAAALLQNTTGWDITSDELQLSAKRIVTIKKIYNILCGWHPESDTLPDRFFESSEGEFNQAINRDDFAKALKAYNQLREYSVDGYVPERLVEKLGLSELSSLQLN